MRTPTLAALACAEFPNDNPDLHAGAIWRCAEPGQAAVAVLPAPAATVRAHLRKDEAPDGDALEDAAAFEDEALEEEAPSLRTAEGTEEAVPLDEGEDAIEIVDELPFECDFEESFSLPPREPALAAASTFESAVAIEAPVCAAFEEAPVEEALLEEALLEEEPLEDEEEENARAAPTDPFVRWLLSLEGTARSLGASDASIACLRALFGQARLDGIDPGERAIEALLARGAIVLGTQGPSSPSLLSPLPRGASRSVTFTGEVQAWQGILRGESEDFALPGGGALPPLDEWSADVVARVLGQPSRADGVRRELRRRGIAAFGLVADAA
jgi:hypothetical protein